MYKTEKVASHFISWKNKRFGCFRRATVVTVDENVRLPLSRQPFIQLTEDCGIRFVPK